MPQFSQGRNGVGSALKILQGTKELSVLQQDDAFLFVEHDFDYSVRVSRQGFVFQAAVQATINPGSKAPEGFEAAATPADVATTGPIQTSIDRGT